jgi:transcriptional regulator with XRE-family HTH domain
MPSATLNPNTIGDNIREAREALEITQLALAHKIGYRGEDAGAHICRLEAGQHEPRVKTLTRIAKALRTTVPRLLAGKK